MNHSESQLRINPRIVPPDLLLKFGYSPSGGIEFDSAAETLSFYQGGTQRVDIRSFGLAVRNGEGLVVGHTAQVTVDARVPELQVLGTAGPDSTTVIGAFSNDSAGPDLQFVKGRDAIGVTTTVLQADDRLGRLIFMGVDSTDNDFNNRGAAIDVLVDGTPGQNDMPARIVFQTSPDGSNTLTEALRIDSSQNVSMRNESHLWIGPDSAATGFVDGNLAVGLVINQEANTDQIIGLKSSAVAHAFGVNAAVGTVETDTFAYFAKISASGGLQIEGIADDGGNRTGMSIRGGSNTNSDTTKTSSGRATFEFYAYQHDNAGSFANIVADGNTFVFRSRVGGTFRTSFLIDEDGDLFADSGTTTTAVTVYDSEDDISLVRAFDIARADAGNDGLIRDRWDKWVGSNESDLVRHGILGAPLAEGGLVNVTRLQQLHNGAIWQQHTAHMSLVERVDSLAIELTEAKQQLAALTA